MTKKHRRILFLVASSLFYCQAFAIPPQNLCLAIYQTGDVSNNLRLNGKRDAQLIFNEVIAGHWNRGIDLERFLRSRIALHDPEAPDLVHERLLLLPVDKTF